MKYLKNLSLFVLITFLLVLPILSFAQNTTAGDKFGNPSGTTAGDKFTTSNANTKIVNPIKATSVQGLIKTALETAIKIGIPVLALAIIYSGFLFVAAQGNSEKLDEAKRSLLYTIIGAAILLGSWAIAQLITETVRAL